MKYSVLLTGLTALALTGCDKPATPTQPTVAPDLPAAAPVNPNATALGLTEAQLLDLDLVTAQGQDLGDIEGVTRDASGAITHLMIKVKATAPDPGQTTPDRYVQIPLDGLSVVKKGDDTEIASHLTADQLAALPDAQLPAVNVPG